VRELASRSAKAANEIKALISASTAQVTNGVTLVNRTGAVLTEIEQQARGVTALIGDIVSTANEQVVVISEIKASVTSLDQATQKNAAMAAETTSACRALGDEAHTLEDIVNRFQVDAKLARAPRKAA
jgi:methyl-accepting chemotaxis protein